MRSIGRNAERVFVVFALSIFSWALIPLLQYKSGFSLQASEGNRLIQLLALLIYLVTSAIVVRRWRYFLAVATAHKLTLALVAVALVSALWSTAPEITMRRSIALLGTTLFGFYLVTRFDDRELLRLLAWTLGPAAALSLLFAVGLPDYGRHTSGPHVGAWRGIYPDKNSFGRIMVVSTLVHLLVALGAQRRRWTVWAGAALSAGLVVLSTSSSALILLVGMVALLALYFTLRWHYRILIPWLIAITLLASGSALVFVSYSETLFALLGKDPTLTGRTDLWEAVTARIAERPVLGHGYSGFWLGSSGPGGEVWREVQWNPPHAHNGFLDLWLDLGIVGVIVFAAGFAVAVRWGLRRVRSASTVDGFWPMVFLAFTVLYNLTESTLLQQNNIFWVLYVSAVAAAMRWPAETPTARTESDPAQLPGSPVPVGAPLSPGIRRRLRKMHGRAPLGAAPRR